MILKIFRNFFNSSSEIKNFIQDPTQSIKKQNEVISFLSEKLNFSKNFKKLLFLLIEKRRIFYVRKIFENFLKHCSKNRG